MTRCPQGHESSTGDYCSICGTPMPASPQPAGYSAWPPSPAPQVAATPPTPSGPSVQPCPVCGSVAAVDAFFCETCGYDFLTGSLPRGVARDGGEAGPAEAPPPAAEALVGQAPAQGAAAAAGEQQSDDADSPDAPQRESVEAPPASPVTTFDLGEVPTHAAVDSPLVAEPAPQPQQSTAPRPPNTDLLSLGEPERDVPDPGDLRPIEVPPRPAPTAPGPARWVAEIWIDPEWYRIQQAPEQLPSPGQPLIQSLRKSTIVIGRTSASGRPDLDCVTDTGVSRRQAVLTTDGIRWFLEDLGSSNGTYIGQVDRPLPTAPISGRVELGPHDRIYVGSWTRIVVRPALMQEAEL